MTYHRSLLLLVALCASPSFAGVAVLANRTDEKVYFAVPAADSPAPVGGLQTVPLAPRETITLQVDDPLPASVYLDREWQKVLLPPNSIHYFVRQGEKLSFVPVALPGAPQAANANGAAQRKAIATMPLMILVDENEPAVQRVWEKRLRDRVQAASDIFTRTCRVRLEVVAVGTWASDDTITRFERSLLEFEQKVNPAPARVAVGFTSQYQIPRGKVHLGGTRGPLHSHVLIREWSNHVTERERLEILVHELGHFLGAIHSAEPDSVMRPNLGDRKAHARDFRIQFDPGNAFAMFLVGEELRRGELPAFNRISEPTKAWLRAAYRGLAPAMPDDGSAAQYLAALDAPQGMAPTLEAPKTLIASTRAVVQAITETAARNAKLPERSGVAPGIDARAAGDRLTELCIRRAASAARRLPPEHAPQAFLLGIGLGLDRSTLVRNTPLLSEFCRQVESDDERKQRLAVLGAPTVRTREDAAEHFVISCLLTALAGPAVAESAGVAKELDDARGPSGFSFADLAADLAGIQFAQRALTEKDTLARLSLQFAVDDFVPPLHDFREKIAWKDFLADFGSTNDERYREQIASIRQMIAQLPAYRPASQSAKPPAAVR